MAGGLARLMTDNPLTALFAGAVDRVVGTTPPDSVHQFRFDGLTGTPIDLAAFQGHPLLVVNTASKCGFTPQYRGLETLYETYGPRGLAVVGVPSNDFGGQEPGSGDEIAAFCHVNYGVSFPLAAKVAVVGAAAHPLFRWLARVRPFARPRWNFHKYLFDGRGYLVAAAGSATRPEGMASRVEALL